MTAPMLESYVAGRWYAAAGRRRAGRRRGDRRDRRRRRSTGVDVPAMLDHARSVGGPALRELTFHQRAALLKALGAAAACATRTSSTRCPRRTGATDRDAPSTSTAASACCSSYAQQGPARAARRHGRPGRRRRAAGQAAARSSASTSARRCAASPCRSTPSTSRCGASLEKLAPAFLAGVPTVVKPASQTAYLTEAVVRLIVESGLLPEGSRAAGRRQRGRPARPPRPGRTSSSSPARPPPRRKLRSTRRWWRSSVRFNAEADSLNCSVLGPDADAGHPGVRPVRRPAGHRDDGQGRAEVHRDPPRARAPRR